MILVPSLKLAFIHVPKTGGSTVTAALRPHLPPSDPPKGRKGWHMRFHRGNMHERICDIRWEKPDGWLSFAAVREPFSRMFSYYASEGTDLGFVEWLQAEKRARSYASQRFSQFNVLRDGDRVGVDVVVRFETMGADLAALGISMDGIWENRGEYAPAEMLKAYEAPGAVDLVRHYADRDFDEFGYSPDFPGARA